METSNYIIKVKGVLINNKNKRIFKVYVENSNNEAQAIQQLKSHFSTFEVISTQKELYKVILIQRKTGNKRTIEKNLTRAEAIRIVKSYPDFNNKMYCFDKQFIKTDFSIFTLN